MSDRAIGRRRIDGLAISVANQRCDCAAMPGQVADEAMRVAMPNFDQTISSSAANHVAARDHSIHIPAMG